MDLIAKNTTSVIQDGKTMFIVRKLSGVDSKPIYSFCKRLFDIVASLAAIIVLAIPMLITFALMKRKVLSVVMFVSWILILCLKSMLLRSAFPATIGVL